MTFIPYRYQGYTYPRIFDNRVSQAVWKRLFCPRGWHLWDEVLSSSDHVLFCDACDVEFGEREEEE